MDQREEGWKAERTDMNQKLQDLLMHNEKVKDECLKKVLVYKDKYTDYKQKVRQANQQISLLTQRVARYEMEKGMSPTRGGAHSSKKPSPDRGAGASDQYIDEYQDEDEDAYEEEE